MARLGWVAACVAGSLCIGAAHAAAPDELTLLREQLQQQHALIELQQKQLDAQDARLQEQERLLRALAEQSGAAASSGGVPNAAPATAPATVTAVPGGEPARPNSVADRFPGVDVTVGGALRTTLTTTNARMQPDATPFFVLPPVPGVPDGTTKLDARLSSLFISVQGAEVGGFQLSGKIYAYLFDGDLFSGKYGVYPGFAYVDATRDDWRIAAGLQMDVFSPMIPTMVDRMSALAGSGNPGNSFRPQLRVERFLSHGADKFVLQGALSDALPSNIEPGFADSTENTGAPNIEARFAWTRGGADEALLPWPRWTLGVSAIAGSFRTLYDSDPTPGASLIRSYDTDLHGVAVEGGLRIGERFGLQGEVYGGRALGPYLATIFQTVNGATQEPISSEGIWGEAAWYWTRHLHSHFGYGIDRADSSDNPAFRSNETAFGNLFWDPSVMTTLGIEFTWRRTEYLGGLDNDGFALMLSSELRF